MGARGPVPKRSQERRRRNAESQSEKLKVHGLVSVPTLPKTAHPIARRWYRSLAQSAQCQYFEPSDWAAALMVVEQMTRLLDPQAVVTKEGDVVMVQGPLGGPAFASLWSAMADLFTTESARRRAHIEVERLAEQESAAPEGVSAIADFRKRMEA